MSHDNEIEHIKGTTNIFADLLSRLPRNDEIGKMMDKRERKECVIMKLDNHAPLNLAAKFKDLTNMQKQDVAIAKLRARAPELANAGDSKYAIQDDVLYKLDGRDYPTWKTYVPSCMEEEIIKNFHHGLGHSGTERVILSIQEHLYVKRLANKVRKFIAKCQLCQRAKPMNVKYDTVPQTTIREEPRALVAVDTHGPIPTAKLGYKHIFVMYDVCTKFVKIYPLKALSTRVCLNKIFSDYVPRYGKVQAILSDNASIFASAKWSSALRANDIKVYHSSSYLPQANPSERGLREISTYLRIFCHKSHKTWLEYCPVIEAIMNRSPNPTTRVSPEKLFTGEEPPSLFHGIPQGIKVPTTPEVNEIKLAVERVRKRAEQRKKRAKRHRKKWNPAIGDQVWVREHSLSDKLAGRYHRMQLLYKGPYVINMILGEHTYELRQAGTNKIIGRFHKQMLRPYIENT